MPISHRRLRLNGALARAPRWLVLAGVVIFGAAGVRATFAPRVPTPVLRSRATTAATDFAAEAFAQAFARAYLSWSPGTSDQHDAAVARFASSQLDAGAGLRPPQTGAQTVDWTAVAGDSPRGTTRVVSVLVGTTNGDLTLAVPVQRDVRGLLSVATYPALIGPPPADPQPPELDEAEVEDDALAAVARRVVTNYLARSAQNLAADLAPDAVVVMPAEALHATRFHDITWARPRRDVAVVVGARGAGGLQMTLRYELAVVHSAGRWLVRAVEINPIHPEVMP